MSEEQSPGQCNKLQRRKSVSIARFLPEWQTALHPLRVVVMLHCSLLTARRRLKEVAPNILGQSFVSPVLAILQPQRWRELS